MRRKSLLIIFTVLCCLTVLTVLGSVIFRVQVIEAYCYNATDPELEQRVLGAHGLKTGKSIFFVNEQEISDNIYSEVKNIRIVNIERKFPNRIYINYIKELEYFRVEYNTRFYMFSNSGKLVRIADTFAESESIKLKIKNNLTSLNIGDAFSTDAASDAALFGTVVSALENLRPAADVIQMFEFVDITKNFIYLKTRTGLYFEVQNPAFMLEKLKLGWDTYAKNLTDVQRKTGTLTLSGTPSTQIMANYSAEIKYE